MRPRVVLLAAGLLAGWAPACWSRPPELVLQTDTEQWYKRVSFTPDGRRLLVGGNLYDAATGRRLRRYPGVTRWAAVTPDGRHVAAVTGAGTVTLFDLPTGAVVRAFGPHPGRLDETPVVGPDGAILAVPAGPDVVLWDVATGAKVGTLPRGP